jgi:hypothetical protein
MRGNLLVLGCSYSDLDHHVNHGHRDNSYTIRIKNELGFNNLINLAVSGGSAMMVNRILFQYMANPKFGLPDFVFIQWPYANRNEYFIDDHNIKQAQMFSFTGTSEDGLIYSWVDYSGLDVFKCINDEKYFVVNNSNWCSTSYGVDGNLLNAHQRLSSNMSQRLINLYKEVYIAENYLDKLKIPYAYVESDYFEEGNGLLSQEHHNLEAYSYAKLLCHKKFLIPKVGIQQHSPTYANDNYKDGHPGADSHKRFADAIIPKLRELIQ